MSLVPNAAADWSYNRCFSGERCGLWDSYFFLVSIFYASVYCIGMGMIVLNMDANPGHKLLMVDSM